PQSPREITTIGLLAQTSIAEGTIELGFDLLTEMRCITCGQRETILRPTEKCSLSLRTCPVCQTDTRQPETIHWLDATSGYADRPLAELGIPEYGVIAVQSAAERRFFQLSGEYCWNEPEDSRTA